MIIPEGTMVGYADSDKKIGLGHAVRVLAVLQEWRRRGGKTIFIYERMHPKMNDILQEDGIAQNRVGKRGAISPTGDDDWVVYDAPDWGPGFYAQNAILLDDSIDAFERPSNLVAKRLIVVNPNLYARRHVYNEDEVLTGIRYYPLRHEIPNTREYAFGGTVEGHSETSACGAGVTMFERMASCCIPSVYSFGAQTELNARIAHESGWVKYMGEYKGPVDDAGNGEQIAPLDYKGAERIVNRAMYFPVTLRPAYPSDSMFVWMIRNAPDVRQVSGHPEYITLDSHDEWFGKFINEYQIIMSNGVPAGSVRKFSSSYGCEIGIVLARDFRNVGIGRLAIMMATKKDDVARVHADNRASINAFVAAGFDMSISKVDRPFVLMRRVR
jgi:hypothetical protein